MRRIALFGEDFAHQRIIGALVQRLADDYRVDVKLEWRSARRGHGQVVIKLKQYLRDLEAQPGEWPDLVVVAVDANCKGFNDRVKELKKIGRSVQITFAVPDPHIERWLLLDSKAFETVFGRGCNAPDYKCDRGRYKDQLETAIREAQVSPTFRGVDPVFRGKESAEDVVRAINLRRASNEDPSFRRFVESLRRTFRTWQQ